MSLIASTSPGPEVFPRIGPVPDGEGPGVGRFFMDVTRPTRLHVAFYTPEAWSAMRHPPEHYRELPGLGYFVVTSHQPLA